MVSATALYTPQVLALATGLATYPLGPDMPLRGQARSQSCGSTLEIGLALDSGGAIARVGLSAHACAIGQAAAMIFAKAAPGKGREEIARAEQAIADWLAGQGATALPDWPGLDAIAAATAFPARHGAILLAWRAALSAFAQAPLPSPDKRG